ncbi:XRE family transcriptional regulator [bacterium]|nr:XRE family transcriptional regulator [bacterium]
MDLKEIKSFANNIIKSGKAEDYELEVANKLLKIVEENKKTQKEEEKFYKTTAPMFDYYYIRFRDELDNMQITQKELSEKTGLSQNAISNYKNGNRIASLPAFISICIALNLSVDEMFELGEYNK